MEEPADTALLRLIGLVYDAALDPSRWNDAIDAIRLAVGGEAGAMFHHDRMVEAQIGRSIDFVGVSGYQPSNVSTYQHYAPIDTRVSLIRKKPAGGVYVDDRDSSFNSVTKTEIFHDFFLPLSLGHGIAANLFTSENRLTLFSVHRHLKDGVFTPQAIRLFEALAPHVTRALQLHRQASLLRIQRDGAAQALDGLAAGIIVVDRMARVLWASDTGEHFLSAADGIGLSRNRLVAFQSGTSKALANGQSTISVGTTTITITIATATAAAPSTVEATDIGAAQFNAISSNALAKAPSPSSSSTPVATSVAETPASSTSTTDPGTVTPSARGSASSTPAPPPAGVPAASPAATVTSRAEPIDSADRAMAVMAAPAPVKPVAHAKPNPLKVKSQVVAGLVDQVQTPKVNKAGTPGITGNFSSSGNTGRW